MRKGRKAPPVDNQSDKDRKTLQGVISPKDRAAGKGQAGKEQATVSRTTERRGGLWARCRPAPARPRFSFAAARFGAIEAVYQSISTCPHGSGMALEPYPDRPVKPNGCALAVFAPTTGVSSMSPSAYDLNFR